MYTLADQLYDYSFSNVVSTLFELGVPRAQFVDSEGWTMANRDEESK